MALTAGVSFYDKHHLVPFAEYFPVPAFVRSWLRLMSLPYSDFTAGAADQPPLQAGGFPVAVSVCYEDAYPASLRGAAGRAALLVNVTNDAWFGHSPARYQHLQISRMLAMVSGRYLVRAGNDGVSAIIGPRGDIKAAADEFRPAVLNGTVIPRRGLSPYIRHGDWPVLGAGILALALACGRRQYGRRAGAAPDPP
jgi:apolipoprotein N-acyltransferase